MPKSPFVYSRVNKNGKKPKIKVMLKQELEYQKQEWKNKQIKADAVRSIYGYDVNNDYAWATNMLRSISLKIYNLNK